jgi:hypothetical protein
MRWVVIGMALRAAGCGEKVDKNISAMLETDFQKGTVIMTCRESSSGTCYALFTFKDDVVRIEAAKGTATTATGITDFSRYCLDVAPPKDGCELKPLTEGQQIVRHRATHS